MDSGSGAKSEVELGIESEQESEVGAGFGSGASRPFEAVSVPAWWNASRRHMVLQGVFIFAISRGIEG